MVKCRALSYPQQAFLLGTHSRVESLRSSYTGLSLQSSYTGLYLQTPYPCRAEQGGPWTCCYQTCSRSLTLTHSVSLSLSLPLSPSLSPSHTHSLCLSLPRSFTLTHSVSMSRSGQARNVETRLEEATADAIHLRNRLAEIQVSGAFPIHCAYRIHFHTAAYFIQMLCVSDGTGELGPGDPPPHPPR